jgi:hypothetical protein
MPKKWKKSQNFRENKIEKQKIIFHRVFLFVLFYFSLNLLNFLGSYFYLFCGHYTNLFEVCCFNLIWAHVIGSKIKVKFAKHYLLHISAPL